MLPPDPIAMSKTFDEIEMPFRLFKAPVDAAATDEAGTCAVCDGEAEVRFGGACYRCFRAGGLDRTVDTEFGMVGAEEVMSGVTHGVPAETPEELGDDLDVVAKPIDPDFPEERWYGVRVPPDELQELTRTPGYHSWQGESWRFCCGRPAIFIGALSSEHLQQLAKDRESSLVDVALSVFGGSPPDAKHLLGELADGAVNTYGFRCQRCANVRGHWDMD